MGGWVLSVILPSPYLGEGTGVRAVLSVSWLFEMTISIINYQRTKDKWLKMVKLG